MYRRSLHRRNLDHIKAVTNDDINKSAMTKHYRAAHTGTSPKQRSFVTKVLSSRHSTLQRVVEESLRLEAGGALANSKGEHGRGGGLVRQHTMRTN